MIGRALISLAIFVFSGACVLGETATIYGDAEKTWYLVEIDGEDFPTTATLTFPQPDRMSGEAPCNLYGANLNALYPAFQPGPIMSTQRACAFLAEEQAFFDALSTMTLAEVMGDTMTLSAPVGREMVFKAGD